MLHHQHTPRLYYADGTRVRINDRADSPKGCGVVRQLQLRVGLVTIVSRDGCVIGDFAPSELQKVAPDPQRR